MLRAAFSLHPGCPAFFADLAADADTHQNQGAGAWQAAFEVDFLLEEYHAFFDDATRTEKSRSYASSTRKLRKFNPSQGLQRAWVFLFQQEPAHSIVPAFYKPLNFVLSEYHGFMFRLTPF